MKKFLTIDVTALTPEQEDDLQLIYNLLEDGRFTYEEPKA